MSVRLFGSYTSPFVRQTRVLALELGIEIEQIDTKTEAGQTALRALSPIWKIPAIEDGDATVFDSAAIGRYLEHTYGTAETRLSDNPEATNLLAVINGAADALINVFYLEKDGVSSDVAYVQKQRDRAVSALSWVETQLDAPLLSTGFSRAAIALACGLAWMRLRDAYPVANHPKLTTWLAERSQRPSMTATVPS